VAVPPDLIEEFRAKGAEILKRLDALSGLEPRLANLEKAFLSVTEIRETVTDLSRRVEHVTDQLATHAETVQGAAEAHGSTNALGHDVLGAVNKLRADMEAFAASMNRPFGQAV
jgi:hypothetical protein